MTTTAIDRTLSDRLGHLTTRSGTSLRLRPVKPADAMLLRGLFARVSRDDMRFRFLVSRAQISCEDLASMLEPDRRRSEHVLAFDTATGELVASLMLVAAESLESAEIAIVVADGWKGRGIGHALLSHAIELASARGIKRLRSLEDRSNAGALEVERTLGFHLHEVEDEPTLVLAEADLA